MSEAKGSLIRAIHGDVLDQIKGVQIMYSTP